MSTRDDEFDQHWMLDAIGPERQGGREGGQDRAPPREPTWRKAAPMAQEVRGVIAPGKGEPVRVEAIVVPDPG
ncbi:hypothetical protein, partial [Streptomyces sp. NPDC053560]|uniref:hypothetical protein n=1 Tax=Streptomyces sp. NPDC053560 TaxID=3365711 RepID=UPI0037D8416A